MPKARMHIRWLVLALAVAAPAQTRETQAGFAKTKTSTVAEAGWPAYGGDAFGQRYSQAAQINTSNVEQLKVAWTMHTHALDKPGASNAAAAFEATPVLWNGTLYFDTPFDQIFAVDARTGKVKWTFDPRIARERVYLATSRGVSLWHAKRPSRGVICGSDEVLVATYDRRLIARDARTGEACPNFGKDGTVDLAQGVTLARVDLYFFTSPPTVVGNMIVTGSSVGDDQQIFAGSGAVRGFDARTGKQMWSWEPVRWTGNQHPPKTGSGNAWAPLAADPEHDLVFVPTGSASVDYYGGLRIGDNRDADSIVALRASTGEKVWAFQLVHHDLWDYDTASQPLLFQFRGAIPAVAVTNKTGMIYVFNRLNGTPLYPIEERKAPATDLQGEVAWPTQPFSTLPGLIPQTDSPADIRDGAAADQEYCRKALARVRSEGLFTPPSEKETLIFPAALGGPNWGSSALDPRTNVLYTRVTVLPYTLRMVKKKMTRREALVDRWKFRAPEWLGGAPRPADHPEYRPPDLGLAERDVSNMDGAPYAIDFRVLMSPGGLPCAPGPFGRLVATNLDTGKQVWSVAHGMLKPGVTGSPGLGGAIVTAGGLVFVASSNDAKMYAYEEQSGKVLGQWKLPATANATPMTYELDGRQYVVIAVGGHRLQKNDESDTVVAFALPESATATRAGRRR